MLSLLSKSCEEKSIWIALLSSLQGLHFTQSQTMNKIILTHDRVSMSIVEPSGCGKPELLFQMPKGSTFYPRYVKIYYFYKKFQQFFKDMQRVIPGIEFLKYSSFDIT